jgi:hypothetical protein
MLAFTDNPFSWFLAGLLVIPFVLVLIGAFVFALRKDKRMGNQLSAFGLRRVSVQKYEGQYRGFHVVIQSISGQGVGAAGDNPSWTGFEVEVSLFNPIDGGSLTPDQRDILGGEGSHSTDDVGLRMTSAKVEGNKLVYRRTIGSFDGDANLMQLALDGGVAQARELLLKMTGEDVWKDDPKMLAKRDAARSLAPWERLERG